ncbi:hypothetical protein RM780_17030 [Streptomyces sp. DSM 44917]|uniref:PIN domain-containing protein n=1 Tax=Streptomyces boetiae TaxID=3075541 RepID=A0ABU2LB07_9ACTN|nr:hypothetical protein [Streptomyces sp. DSM 44917]MDT0308651.1 hypothetical protein [Streptomyces sp. DSM 44917]
MTPRVFVWDCEALSRAVRGDRRMALLLKLAGEGEARLVTSPMTLVEAYDGRVPERRWDWVLSRVTVTSVGKQEAKQARLLLKHAGMHGHKHAIEAVLAVIARGQRGEVTVFSSDAGDMERLLPPQVPVVKL